MESSVLLSLSEILFSLKLSRFTIIYTKNSDMRLSVVEYTDRGRKGSKNE